MASSNQTIAIVATGPSVLEQDLTAIPADTIIAVNGAIDLVNPDIWFTLDLSPDNLQRLTHPRPGIEYIVGWCPERHSRLILPAHVRKVMRLKEERSSRPPALTGPEYWMWRWSAKRGLSEDPRSIHTGNSAYGALGLAYHMRPAHILLYGIDGSRHDRATGGRPNRLDHLPLLFASAVPQLEKVGIDVVNMSPKSRLCCFN